MSAKIWHGQFVKHFNLFCCWLDLQKNKVLFFGNVFFLLWRHFQVCEAQLLHIQIALFISADADIHFMSSDQLMNVFFPSPNIIGRTRLANNWRVICRPKKFVSSRGSVAQIQDASSFGPYTPPSEPLCVNKPHQLVCVISAGCLYDWASDNADAAVFVAVVRCLCGRELPQYKGPAMIAGNLSSVSA